MALGVPGSDPSDSAGATFAVFSYVSEMGFFGGFRMQKGNMKYNTFRHSTKWIWGFRDWTRRIPRMPFTLFPYVSQGAAARGPASFRGAMQPSPPHPCHHRQVFTVGRKLGNAVLHSLFAKRCSCVWIPPPGKSCPSIPVPRSSQCWSSGGGGGCAARLPKRDRFALHPADARGARAGAEGAPRRGGGPVARRGADFARRGADFARRGADFVRRGAGFARRGAHFARHWSDFAERGADFARRGADLQSVGRTLQGGQTLPGVGHPVQGARVRG